MKISNQSTDNAVLAELGGRLRRTRLERNLSQEQVAKEAGVSRFTVKRIEEGKPARLTSLIRLLRFLGLLESLEQLVPEPLPSPIDQLRHRGRQRQRARSRSAAEGAEDAEGDGWRWGDEEKTP
ncbi:MAG TPA: helix-turn-helix transcriptional regulator [Solirubrobacterales bacterium]|jgi:transcriptional regulator with XRE-family HTH domain